MIDANLTFAFTAGIIATINPCGFAMLPAYLSFFLGLEGDQEGNAARAGLGRALATGGLVSAGFLVVFGAVGLLVTAGLEVVRGLVPWISIAIGVAITVLGLAVLGGRSLTLMLPKLERGTGDRRPRSLMLFGVSYAVASISCGLPTFLVVVSTSVDDVGSSLASFVAYAIGMALVLTSLTVSLAMARQSLVRRLRSLLPYVDRVAGVLMVVAGLYLTWYWLAERLGADRGGVVLGVEQFTARLGNWITGVGGLRLGIGMSIVVALAAIAALGSTKPTTD